MNRLHKIFALALVTLTSLGLTLGAQESQNRWWEAPTGPAYQVLVYSFADADGNGMGDLRGLINQLDYLNDGKGTPGDGRSFSSLGVSAIWLSPINTARAYHGYDVTDYYSIDRRLGTMEDFEELIAEAHKRGIKVIMDLVFNHTSSAHPWFTSFQNEPEGPHADWYVERDPDVRYGTNGMGRFYNVRIGPDRTRQYFAAFYDGMPDLNSANPAVLAELQNVLTFWLGKGVDGFRFDAVKHSFDPNEYPAGTNTLQLNREFWSALTQHAQSIKPDVFTIGEVLTGNVQEIAAWTGVYSSLFDFATASETLKAAGSLVAGTFAPTYQRSEAQFLRNNPNYINSNILTNHDQDRVMSVIMARVSGNWRDALARAQLAASITQLLPGLPWIYYGEELGMEGRRFQNDDINRRIAMPWVRGGSPLTPANYVSGARIESGINQNLVSVQEQARNRNSLLNHYRRLVDLRVANETIRSGAYFAARDEDFTSSNPNVVAWYRSTPAETLLVVHNLGSGNARLTMASGALATQVWTSAAGLVARPPRANATIQVSRYSTMVVRLPSETHEALMNR